LGIVKLPLEAVVDIDLTVSAENGGSIRVSLCNGDAEYFLRLRDLYINPFTDDDYEAADQSEYAAAQIGKSRIIAELEALIARIKAEC
jgi:hypothetical protein